MNSGTTSFSDALLTLFEIDDQRQEEWEAVQRQKQETTPGAVTYSNYASYKFQPGPEPGTFQYNVKDRLEDLFKLSGKPWTLIELFACEKPGADPDDKSIYGWATVKNKSGAIIEMGPDNSILVEETRQPGGHGLALLVFMGRLNGKENFRIRFYKELLKTRNK
ncbi:MAG: hypothetical protein FWF97_02765 [Alphaproteobacteria bacterium]|nr:hypothetical protein [Alphaproteobacteria bacterium]